jgi:aldehyde:ferredoxin oxidoreductase
MGQVRSSDGSGSAREEGKGGLLKTLWDPHAFSDSLDLCKFSAFTEDAEFYAAQYATA